MSRAMKNMFLWIAWLIFTLMGVCMFIYSLSPFVRESMVQYAHVSIQGIPLPWLQWCGAAILIISLLALWSEIRASRRSPSLCYSTAEGEVVIALSTLDRFITQVLRKCTGIARAKVTTEKDHRKVNVFARVRLDGEQTVATSVSEAQVEVRRRVQAIFGLDLLRDIHIEVMHVNEPRETSHRPGLLPWQRDADDISNKDNSQDTDETYESSDTVTDDNDDGRQDEELPV